MDNTERARQVALAFRDQLRDEIESSRFGSIKRFAVETGRSYGSFRRYFLDADHEHFREPQLSVIWLALIDLSVDQGEFVTRALERVQQS